MSKTQALRGVIAGQLNQTAGTTYHRRAAGDAAYPYKVYSLRSVDLGDTAMDVFTLEVELFDRQASPTRIETLADEIESRLRYVNLPQETVLPTIWRESRQWVEDDDKELQRILLRFTVQLYENT